MVNTRSGFNRESRLSREEMNEYSGDEDNMSVVDHFAGNANGNEDLNDMREIERDHEKHRIEQRFMEMNRQISELTSIVRALTDKMSNSREENYRDAHNSETSVRSDKGSVRFVKKNSSRKMHIYQEKCVLCGSLWFFSALCNLSKVF